MRLVFWLLLQGAFHAAPLPHALLEEHYSTVSLGADGRLLRIGLSPRGTYRIPLTLAEISPDLKQGVLAYEDHYFYTHPGVNPIALVRSALANMRHARVVMGGSTITMQVAKLMEPKPRTLRSKLFEIFRAFQLESVYSKDQILALYLNLVPMGGNIEGVGAASYLYFGKPARELSLAESALLIGIPRSPGHFRPDRHVARATLQRDRVLEHMRGNLSTEAVLRAAHAAPIPRRRFPNPHAYPHFLARLPLVAGVSAPAGFSRRVTIDPRLQALAEGQLRQTLQALASAGVYNGAVIIVENATQSVRAYVGSPDFMDTAHGGQINGADIRRSPGSLLKPFLYGLAIDQGHLTPRQLVFDIDRNYDGYIPANFDRHFAGPVSAEEALVRSLNVPAVNLEFELGANGLVALLRRAGLFSGRRAELAPGLSAVLGAVPLTLEELVRLYAALANGGEMKELHFLESQKESTVGGIRILSPEAAFLVADMLSKLERPDLPQSWEFTPNRGKIAFKTGTSFGLRDAWSVGFNPRYTIGVWLGNVDAKGSSALVGIKAAAPLLVSLFNDVNRYDDGWFRAPPGVKKRAVCALSGEPAGPDCPAHVTDFYIPGVSAALVCTVHRRITVRKKDGVEMCRLCMDGPRRAYSERVVEVWPPDVASFLRKRGDSRVFTPPHNPDCHAARENEGLKIRSPMPGGFYAFTDAVSRGAQKIPLQAQSRQSGEPIFWYIDDVLTHSGAPDQVFYAAPAPGRHRVTVLDALGRHDSVEFYVRRTF